MASFLKSYKVHDWNFMWEDVKIKSLSKKYFLSDTFLTDCRLIIFYCGFCLYHTQGGSLM